MDAKVPETLHVDAFQMRFADIADVDLEKLHALSMAVGWPHRAEDWQYLLDLGHGFAALDEIGRVMGSAMWFPHGEQFATLGMTITSPRLQANGTAKWLLQRVLAECRGRTFRLNATRAARRLCHTMGFVVQQTVFQCQGDAVKPAEAAPVAGHVLRRLERSDLEAVVAFDAQAFAVPRPVHLARLFETSVCYGLFQDDRLCAYSMSRSFGRGHVVGPIVASCEDDAVTVARPHFVALAGGFLRVDTHFDTGVFASFIQECGLPALDTVTTMTLGERTAYSAPGDNRPVAFGLASQSIG